MPQQYDTPWYASVYLLFPAAILAGMLIIVLFAGASAHPTSATALVAVVAVASVRCRVLSWMCGTRRCPLKGPLRCPM